MAQYATLKAAIDAVIKANGQKEITGTVLNEVLTSMVNSLGANYQFAGVATPSTNPGTPDQNVFYIAGQGGTYTNFNNIAIPNGISFLIWNGSWSSQTVLSGDGGVFDISAYKATGGTLATFADLSAALGENGANIPVAFRKGGMSVKFIQGSAPSSDNNYYQFRYMSSSTAVADFTNVANWQGVDDEPTVESKNLVKSGGVLKTTNSHVFTDNALSNSLIKELYLYKQDGTPINDTLYVNRIDKNIETGGYFYYFIITNGSVNVAVWSAISILSDVIEVPIIERNSSGIYGKAVLDFSKIEDGTYNNLASVINKCAYDLKCSPYLYSSSEILKKYAEINTKLNNEESKVNHHIYTDNVLSNNLIKELYLYKEDGTPITEPLILTEIYKNHLMGAGPYKYCIVIGDGTQNVSVWSAVSISADIIEVELVERNNSGIIGKAILDFSKIADGYYEANASINQCALDIKCSPYLYAEKQSSALSSQVELNTTDIEHIGDEVFFEETRNIPNVTIVKDKYIYPNGITIADLVGFEYAIMPLSYNVKSVSVTGRHFRAGASLVFKDANDNIVGDIITVNDTIYNTITATKPVNAVKAMTCYRNQGYYDRPILFQALYNVGIKEYVDMIGTDGLELPNVSLIPIFGQSLSVGAAATPPISTTCKYKAGIMFNGGVIAVQKEVSYFTDFIPLVELNNETVASGCVEQLIELLQKEKGINVDSAYWDNHKFLFVSCGAGSKTIAMLMDDYYQGLVNAVQGAKNIADSKGWKIDVPAVIYIQGETDQKYTNNTDYATYKAALQSFRSTFDTDVKSITSQAEDVKVILYQTCSQNIVTSVPHPTYTNTAMDVPTAQMSLVKEDANFCACNPAYMLDHSTVETIHLSAVGEKLMGLYCGMSLKKIITKDALFKGVTPNTYLISGNSITIKYNVPNPPLRFDVNFVKEVANMGYAVIDSNDTDILTSVSIFDDEVTLVCSASPLNCKLYYGFNGVNGRDGRIDGSRGNVCDNGNVINNGNVANKQYGMPNYAYSFAKLLSSENGNI